MKSFFTAHLWFIVGIVVVVAVLGGSWWYISANRAPAVASYTVTRENIVAAIDEPGTVVAENKADLSFREAGQIAHVYVKEGDAVGVGNSLADLDSASLEANVEQANAALAAAQAKLDALQVGATPETIAVSQAAQMTAERSLDNSYASVMNVLNDAYAKANDAARTQLAAFFSNPESNSPQLTFNVSDSQTLNNIQSLRISVTDDLNAWQGELASTTANASDPALEAAFRNALDRLSPVHDLANEAMTALTDEVNFSPTALSAYKISATNGLNEVNAAITEVSNAEQAIASEKDAVLQAQAQLDLTKSSSTPQAIEEQQAVVAQAKAAVSSAQVALDNATLAAPFPGTVQNLTAQVGQVVSPGAPVLSLVNNGGLKIETYVSEADVAKINVRGTAQVTLDAFGTSTVFPATVTTIDSAETQVNGTPSYLVTLHFTGVESKVRDGMTGNVHLVLAEDDNVIVVPSRLVIANGNQYFVLVKTATGNEKRQVQVGLVGDNGMTEITSGLAENDTLTNF